MTKRLDIKNGDIFEYLEIVEEVQSKNRKFICRCVCGNITQPIPLSHLRSGHTKSCGCKTRIMISEKTSKKNIYLKKEKYFEVYDDSGKVLLGKISRKSLDVVKDYYWYNDGTYLAANAKSEKVQKIRMHRILMEEKMTEERPFVDHINGDGTDNRLENLRVVNVVENRKNINNSRKTGFPGVSKISENKYNFSYYVDGKERIVGGFSNPEEAFIEKLKKEKSLKGNSSRFLKYFDKYEI